MEYVARYVQKTALDAARIIVISEYSISYRWTHRESGQTRVTRVTGHEFLRLFLQHVLPRGFRRVRHFGYLSAAAKERYARLRSLLRAGASVLILPEKTAVCCEACGQAMTFLRAIRHHHRATAARHRTNAMITTHISNTGPGRSAGSCPRGGKQRPASQKSPSPHGANAATPATRQPASERNRHDAAAQRSKSQNSARVQQAPSEKRGKAFPTE